MELIYISKNSKFKHEILPNLVTQNAIKKIFLLSFEGENKELELNLCELNLYLERQSVSVKWETINCQENETNNFFYFNKNFWNQINYLTQNLTKFVLLLEIDKLREIKLLLQQKINELLINNLIGIFFLNKKTQKIIFYDCSSNTWRNNFFEKGNNKYLQKLNVALRRSFKEQSLKRFEHTIRVAETADAIFCKLNINLLERDKLLLACAYHDFAKNWTLKKLLYYSKKIFSKDKNELLKNAWMLHGPVASFILKKKNYITNEKILEAIYYHSTPKEELDIIGKILIIADKIEPNKISNFPILIYKKLWDQLRKGKIENAFKFLLKNCKPKTKWKKEE